MGDELIRGQSEGQTPIHDLSDLQLNIQTKDQLDYAENENNFKCAGKYLVKILSDKSAPFNYNWLLKIHKEMFGDVWGWAGVLRKTDKSVGVKPMHIAHEIHRFIVDMQAWQESRKSVFEISVGIHHRLVWIHPFENGNGRWGRFIANLYLHKNKKPIVEWPIEIKEFRPEYLKSLKLADTGDLTHLLKLQEKYWKR